MVMLLEDLNNNQRRIIASTQNIGRVLYLGSGTAIAVLIAKLLADQDSLQVSGITIALDKAWIAFLALTVAHAFLAIVLMREILAYLDDVPAVADLRQVFGQITSEENLFVHGLISRARPRRPGSRIYSMAWRDPSTWVAYIAAAIFMAALLPWRLSPRGVHWASGSGLWKLTLLSAILAVVNWWAGSIWLIYLSQLNDVATWIEGLPDNRVSDEDLSRLVMLGTSILSAGSQPTYRCCYEIANILNRFASIQVPACGKSFLGLTFRPKKPVSLVSEKRLAEVSHIYQYFRDNMPWLIESPSPWFFSEKRVRMTPRSQPKRQGPSLSSQHASRRPKWREQLKFLLDLMAKGSSGF
jgi:hypothetical protein